MYHFQSLSGGFFFWHVGGYPHTLFVCDLGCGCRPRPCCPLQPLHAHTHTSHCRCTPPRREAEAVQQEVMLQPPAKPNERAVQQQVVTRHPAGASRGGDASRGRGATRGHTTTNQGNHEANCRHTVRWQQVNKSVRGSIGAAIGNTTTGHHIERQRCIKRWWREERPRDNQPGRTRGCLELEATAMTLQERVTHRANIGNNISYPRILGYFG